MNAIFFVLTKTTVYSPLYGNFEIFNFENSFGCLRRLVCSSTKKYMSRIIFRDFKKMKYTRSMYLILCVSDYFS